MALRPCGECGQRISERARACPHCGISKPFQSSALRNLDSCSTSGLQLGCGLLIVERRRHLRQRRSRGRLRFPPWCYVRCSS